METSIWHAMKHVNWRFRQNCQHCVVTVVSACKLIIYVYIYIYIYIHTRLLPTLPSIINKLLTLNITFHLERKRNQNPYLPDYFLILNWPHAMCVRPSLHTSDIKVHPLHDDNFYIMYTWQQTPIVWNYCCISDSQDGLVGLTGEVRLHKHSNTPEIHFSQISKPWKWQIIPPPLQPTHHTTVPPTTTTTAPQTQKAHRNPDTQ